MIAKVVTLGQSKSSQKLASNYFKLPPIPTTTYIAGHRLGSNKPHLSYLQWCIKILRLILGKSVLHKERRYRKTAYLFFIWKILILNLGWLGFSPSFGLVLSEIWAYPLDFFLLLDLNSNISRDLNSWYPFNLSLLLFKLFQIQILSPILEYIHPHS